MITLFTGDDAAAHAGLHDQMLRGRAAVFRDQAGLGGQCHGLGAKAMPMTTRTRSIWLSRDPIRTSGALPARFALIAPTTGPTLMRDVFADVFDEDVGSRQRHDLGKRRGFCVHPDAPRRLRPKRMHLATCELAIGHVRDRPRPQD